MSEASGSESWKRNTPGSEGVTISRHATPDEEQTALRVFSAALIFSAVVLALVLYALTSCSSGTMGICKGSQPAEPKTEASRKDATLPESEEQQLGH